MSAIQNYINIVDGAFGAGAITFDLSKNFDSPILTALNNPNPPEFRNNFVERLNRLNKIYSKHPEYLKEILIQVKEIANEKNWEGAFAELAAFDHLNQDILDGQTYIYTPLQPNVTIDKSKTFALELGKHAANLDAYVEDRPVYLDFKVFKDNVNEILKGLYKRVQTHFNRTDINILAEYDLSMPVDVITANMGVLFEELKNGIVLANKKGYVKSSAVPGLGFRIMIGGGVLSAERIHSAFRHAENYHKMIFKNADQIVKDKPSMVVYVVFPWYNGIVTSFSNSNVDLYRSFSRRVFCQYKHDTTPFKTLNPKFTGTQTIYEVSQHLSGIVFLEDNTILGDNPNETNVKSYVYLNPNAINSLSRSLAHDFLLGIHNTAYDDFENDNY